MLPRQLALLLVLFLSLLASCTSPQKRPYNRYQQPEASPSPSTPIWRSSPALRVAATPITASYFPPSMPPARADSLLIIDARTGDTLAQKNADVRRAVASTQKLLTALVVLDNGNLSRRVTIQKSDTRVEPSKLYLKTGESYTRRELLNAILVKSANDAALALARDNAGSIPAFARRMNLKARQLGATGSHFLNPHGLTVSGQYSTARDVARIAFAASRHPFIRHAVTQQNYTFHTPRGPKHLKNTNKLLGRMGACTGMKTGYTRASGRCLVTSASIGSRQVILVQLGSQTKYIFDDAERLMQWAVTQRPPSRRSSYASMHAIRASM